MNSLISWSKKKRKRQNEQANAVTSDLCTHTDTHTQNSGAALFFFVKKKERAKFKNTTLIQEPHFRGIRNGQCSTIMKLYSEKKCFFRTERIFFPASLLNSASDARRPSFVLEESVYRSGSESVHYSCCFCTHCCCPISMQGMGNQNQALSAQCPAYAFDLSQELLFFLNLPLRSNFCEIHV